MNIKYRAFSLIEVVMAMAIVSCSLLLVVGLLSTGLCTVRDSANDQAIAMITTQLRGQIQQISFASPSGITSLPQTNYSYSVEGLPVLPPNPANITPFYQASFLLASPSIASSSFDSTNAATVVVTLRYPPPVYTQTNTFTIFAASQKGL